MMVYGHGILASEDQLAEARYELKQFLAGLTREKARYLEELRERRRLRQEKAVRRKLVLSRLGIRLRGRRRVTDDRHPEGSHAPYGSARIHPAKRVERQPDGPGDIPESRSQSG